MSRAETCIHRILAHEGGFVDHKDDPGGATNKGITIATYRRYIKRRGTVDDLKAMTTAQATTVYRLQYWDAVQADHLPIGVDYAVADYAVNSGPARAAKALQLILGVKTDGKIGPVTLTAARQMAPGDLVDHLCDQRIRFLRRLETWPTFGKGWTSRVTRVQADAHRDIAATIPLAPVRIPETPRAPEIGFWASLIEAFRQWKGRAS